MKLKNPLYKRQMKFAAAIEVAFDSIPDVMLQNVR